MDECTPLMVVLREQGFNMPQPDVRRSRTNPETTVRRCSLDLEWLKIRVEIQGLHVHLEGSHSSTFQLNVGTFRELPLVFSVTKTGESEPKTGRVSALGLKITGFSACTRWVEHGKLLAS